MGKDFLDHEIIEEAIRNSINNFQEIGDIGNEPVFGLCQHLVGVVPKGTASDLLHGPVMSWYEKAKRNLDGYDFTDIWLMFCDIWDGKKVKNPKTQALERAKIQAAARKQDRPELAILRTRAEKEVAHVCYELQVIQNIEPIFLSGEEAGKIIGKNQTMGSILLRKFCRINILKLIKKGHTGHASEYLYIAGDFGFNILKQYEMRKIVEADNK